MTEQANTQTEALKTCKKCGKPVRPELTKIRDLIRTELAEAVNTFDQHRMASLAMTLGKFQGLILGFAAYNRGGLSDADKNFDDGVELLADAIRADKSKFLGTGALLHAVQAAKRMLDDSEAFAAKTAPAEPEKVPAQCT